MFQSVGDPAASRGGVPNLFRPEVLEGQVELVFVSRVVDVASREVIFDRRRSRGSVVIPYSLRRWAKTPSGVKATCDMKNKN